jgi:uncharacterized membrane protein
MVSGDRDRDADTGRYSEEYPPDSFVDAIKSDGGATGTQDVANIVGCSYETAYKKLHKLAEAGTIVRRKVGNVNLWVVDDE